MAKLSNWPTYTLLTIFLFPILVYVVYGYLQPIQTQENSSEPTPQTQVAATPVATPKKVFTENDDWQEIYPNTKEIFFGNLSVQASVAKTWPERILGLSETPYLPDNVVKLFVFYSSGFHSIWMKDMNYAIDIIWLSEDGQIVYVVKNATPESYPESFAPDEPAYYVIEAKAGFVDQNNIKEGQMVVLPDLD